jgi:hypothetical protein
MTTVDIGPAADRHGLTKDNVGRANARSSGANVTPARQLTRLYPLFDGRIAGTGRQNASAGRGGTAPRVSFSLAAVAALPVDAMQAGEGIEGVAQRALNTSRAGGTTGGVALHTPGPLPSRPLPGTAEMAATLTANPGTAICTDGCASGTCVDGHARTFVPAAILAAMAPAVANPYTSTVRGNTHDTVGEVGGAIGPPVVPRNGTPAMAGAAVVGEDTPADGDVQRVLGHSMPRTFTEEQLRIADPRLQRLTTADQ